MKSGLHFFSGKCELAYSYSGRNSDSIHIRSRNSDTLLVSLLSKIRRKFDTSIPMQIRQYRWPTLLSNIRFSASFRRLEESTQLLYLVHDVAPVFQGSISCSVRGFKSNLGQKYESNFFGQTFSCFFFLEIQKGCS